MFEIIFNAIVLVLLCVFWVVICLEENKTKQQKEEYINTLNEHDRAVILAYIQKGRYFKFKKRNKKNDEQKENSEDKI